MRIGFKRCWLIHLVSLFCILLKPEISMRKLMFKGVKRAGAILFLGTALSGAVWAQSAEMAACTSYGSVVTTNLATWDLTQTRATGHNEITANALRIWTEGATSTDKAAG